MMEPKDKISLFAIAATFIVALINLVYTILNNRKTAFVNTVTASRLKWIDSLRDKVSAFISVTARILNAEMATTASEDVSDLLRERDTLMHQVILHEPQEKPQGLKPDNLGQSHRRHECLLHPMRDTKRGEL
jgi:hypothetical protein